MAVSKLLDRYKAALPKRGCDCCDGFDAERHGLTLLLGALVTLGHLGAAQHDALLDEYEADEAKRKHRAYKRFRKSMTPAEAAAYDREIDRVFAPNPVFMALLRGETPIKASPNAKGYCGE